MPTRGVKPATCNPTPFRVLAALDFPTRGGKHAPRYSDRLREGTPVLKTPRRPFQAANRILYNDEHFAGAIRGS